MSEKMLVLSDIDGTVTQNPAIMVRMVELQSQTGTLQPGYLERIRQHFGNYREGRLTYEDFAEGLISCYAEGLKGAQLSVVLSEVRKSVKDGTIPLFNNVANILRVLQSDHDLYFVTASPQFIAQAICERFTSASFISSVFEEDKGYLTGEVSFSLARREAKQSVILDVVGKYPMRGSVSFGDTMVDIAMLEATQTSICVNPEEELKKVALTRGYTILEGK